MKENAIIIPAYNEEKTIADVVGQVKTFGTVIVVNDASSDNTKTVAEKAGAVVVTHKKNGGYDQALQSGFEKANELKCKYAVTIDADGQHKASLVEEYLKRLHEGFDLVMGIRSKKARISEKVFGLYTKTFYGIDDPLCGMKGYSMRLYQELGHFDSFKSTGTELALYGIKKKRKTIQVDVPVVDRVGTPRFGQAIRGNYRIFRSMFYSILKN